MAYQAVFKRYELKYLLTAAQKQALLERMAPYMAPDPYGRTTIRNVYLDTPSCRIIRRSLEKPVYKEKLRLRSYRQVSDGDAVFVELKKKYDGVVYKRRLTMPEPEAMAWLTGAGAGDPSQIGREISAFLDFYGCLRPTVFLSYEREAYHCRAGDDLRVTFDEQILARREDLSLRSEVGGVPLLPQGQVLMEVKTAGGLPLWLTRALTREGLFKASFSKYGKAYETMIYPDPKGEYQYV